MSIILQHGYPSELEASVSKTAFPRSTDSESYEVWRLESGLSENSTGNPKEAVLRDPRWSQTRKPLIAPFPASPVTVRCQF